MKVRSLRCEGCMAPLPAPKGAAVTCSYCGRELVVEGGETLVTTDGGARALTDALLAGGTGEPVGEGRRLAPSEIGDWDDPERSLWPIGASASSEFGGSWRAAQMIGPPRVFPGHGDRPGAWAPRTRDSEVEWVELRYDATAPEVDRIRVFETNLPGATFAVTVIDADDAEVLVWERPPGLVAREARVLEITLDAPRTVRRARVYVNNSLGTSWSEIDTVALRAVEPLPDGLRRRREKRFLEGSGRQWLGCAGALLLGVLGLGWWASRPPDETPPVFTGPGPNAAVDGARLSVWDVDVAGLRAAGVVWAHEATEWSSQYSDGRNAARHAAGPPDVFPASGDLTAAWASLREDEGLEHITLTFDRRVRARAVVIVETFHAGALARVEDVTPGGTPTILWAGTTSSADGARVVSIDLPAPREISRLRILLDTRRVAGWNEIDAVGLVPAE